MSARKTGTPSASQRPGVEASLAMSVAKTSPSRRIDLRRNSSLGLREDPKRLRREERAEEKPAPAPDPAPDPDPDDDDANEADEEVVVVAEEEEEDEDEEGCSDAIAADRELEEAEAVRLATAH